MLNREKKKNVLQEILNTSENEEVRWLSNQSYTIKRRISGT